LNILISRRDLGIINKIKKRWKSLKKNLREIIDSNTRKRIFFFDEARFRTHSKIGHGWFKKGSRTPLKVKLGFKNFYLYSAVELGNGNHFSLQLPYINTDSMQLYLDELAKEIDEEIIIIMDGAGWHKSKELVIPQNIQVIYLPPYSPELNPVERLWLYIKKSTIYNKIYETLEELEETVLSHLLTMGLLMARIEEKNIQMPFQISAKLRKYFKGFCSSPEIIMLFVYMKCRFSLSYRDLEEMAIIRGLKIDHATFQRWVIKFVMLIDTRVRKNKKTVGSSWLMDETYIKVNGTWMYQLCFDIFL
jgi:transposase-like protein